MYLAPRNLAGKWKPVQGSREALNRFTASCWRRLPVRQLPPPNATEVNPGARDLQPCPERYPHFPLYYCRGPDSRLEEKAVPLLSDS